MLFFLLNRIANMEGLDLYVLKSCFGSSFSISGTIQRQSQALSDPNGPLPLSHLVSCHAFEIPEIVNRQKTMANIGKSPFLMGKSWKITIFNGKTHYE